MANEISFDHPPGNYPGVFDLKMLFGDTVKELQYSINAGMPKITKYVAYDTLVPPNPFIAVTQDEYGPVVYDGGVPKFFNSAMAPYPTVPFDDALRFQMTKQGTGSSFHYEMLSAKRVEIEAGDKLVYTLHTSNTAIRSGIDALINGSALIKLQALPILDQNGLSISTSTDLSARAYRKWYTRTFDLSSLAGSTIGDWQMVNGGVATGLQTTWFKDVCVLDGAGNIKAALYTTELEIPNLITGTGGSQGFTDINKLIVDTRDQLDATDKYFYNSLRFVENKDKVAAGNRKVLILGDTIVGNPYQVKGAGGTDFGTHLTHACVMAGYIPTIKDRADYGAALDASLTELNQYCAIVIVSCLYQQSGWPSLITQKCVDAILASREQGNGLIVLTDHGPVMNTIDDAIKAPIGAGYFATANKIITNFGAWFSGDYGRSPVNVGFLRRTYGDHPLYATLTDAEFIFAGVSESRVNVAQYQTYTPQTMPIIKLIKGRNHIQVAATLLDGSVVTFRFLYFVTSVTVTWSDGELDTADGGRFDIGVKNQSRVDIKFSNDGTPFTAAGKIYKNDIYAGTVSYTPEGGVIQKWNELGVGPIRLINGDSFRVELSIPEGESSSITINRFHPYIKGIRSLSRVMTILRGFRPELTDIKRILRIMKDIQGTVPWLVVKMVQSIPDNMKLIADYFDDTGTNATVLPNAATKPYATGRPWVAGTLEARSPINPVTGKAMDYGYFAYSPVYGSEKVPANFKLDYYCTYYIPAGKYRIFSHSDDQFHLYIDGTLRVSNGSHAVADLTITESRWYALKVANVNVPNNTPSYWTCLMVDLATGAIVLKVEPGVWKTMEYSSK